MYVSAYELAKANLSESKMADALGIMVVTLRKWRIKNPAFKDAIQRGRAHIKHANGETIQFHEYIFQKLPEHLKGLWKEIKECETAPNGVSRMEALFQRHGLRARQQLFVYALTASTFNASEACRRVGIGKRVLDSWIQFDPTFAELMDEIHWHKGNFFENQMIDLVDAGHPLAVIHVNKTFNAKRGYGNSVQVEHTGQVNHLHASIDLAKLDLPLDVRKQILEAYRTQKSESVPPGLTLEMESKE